MSSLAISIPKDTIVLPSNVRFSTSGKDLIVQKVRRRTKRFKMTKVQRNKISAATKKFKFPILTGLSVAPAAFLAFNDAMQSASFQNRILRFSLKMIEFYSGISISPFTQQVSFIPQSLLVGWGPLLAVVGIKTLAKGRVMAINRALSRAQIPANLG